MKPRNELLVLSVTSTAILTAAVADSSSIVSSFREIFENLNIGVNDLPLSTNIVFSTYIFWWMFPLATISLGLFVFNNEPFSVQYRSALLRVFFCGFVLALLLWLLAQESMYDAMRLVADEFR